jgi:uncharacterized protein YceK
MEIRNTLIAVAILLLSGCASYTTDQFKSDLKGYVDHTFIPMK